MKRIAVGKPSGGKRVPAFAVLCAITALALPAQTFTSLLSFDGTDGYGPYDAPVQARNGNFYGTTEGGGANRQGTVFQITSGGTPTTLYSFCAQSSCTDGAAPSAGLVQGANGDFYGTTYGGGANSLGTVFKITPGGTLTTLYSFCVQSECTDGGRPYAGLVLGTNGEFYGTTLGGGAHGGGTVFKITPHGALTTLYSFCALTGCPDGNQPAAGLIQATNGDFYGTTEIGGVTGCPPYGGCGTIFKITPAGTLTTLYRFCSQGGCPDGYYPTAALVQATNGDFYGTTSFGGASQDGTVFKITPKGKLTTLYSFCAENGCPDGENPSGALIQATNGDFYGTAHLGGANAAGTIFEITPGGTLTTLYTFCTQSGCADGEYPFAGLTQATNGDFYGTTYVGGASKSGLVFGLSVGLGAFVETQPTSGRAGAAVNILGTNQSGSTGVAFNGTPAAFTVVSPSLITATVPSGATTGTVQVVTPGGTLSSNVPFRVLP